jgi:hypothetical protein
MLLSIRTACRPTTASHTVLRCSQGTADPYSNRSTSSVEISLALQALDDPCQDGVVPFGQHEVDESEGAVIHLEDRLEHEGLGQVAASTLFASPDGAISQRPCSGRPSRAGWAGESNQESTAGPVRETARPCGDC